jgi:hypothetical protein
MIIPSNGDDAENLLVENVTNSVGVFVWRKKGSRRREGRNGFNGFLYIDNAATLIREKKSIYIYSCFFRNLLF